MPSDTWSQQQESLNDVPSDTVANDAAESLSEELRGRHDQVSDAAGTHLWRLARLHQH